MKKHTDSPSSKQNPLPESSPQFLFVFREGVTPTSPSAVKAFLPNYEEWHVGYPSLVQKGGSIVKGYLIDTTPTLLSGEEDTHLLGRTDDLVDLMTDFEFHRIPVTVLTEENGFPIRAWVYQHIGHATPEELALAVPQFTSTEDLQEAVAAI